jgi:hypothetical protein
LTDKTDIENHVQTALAGHKLGQYITCVIRDDGFDFEVDQESISKSIQSQSKNNEDRAEMYRLRYQRQLDRLTEKLKKIRCKINRGFLWGKGRIGLRIGRIINKYRVAKHFNLSISDNDFTYEINPKSVSAEAAFDGVYIIRTSLSRTDMLPEQVVVNYKRLSVIERAFRSFKTIDLKVRPIRHRLEDRVRAHIFLCMLAYYVQWHMMEAWRSLLYSDEDQQIKKIADPVAPAQRSDKAKLKAQTKHLDDGSRVYDFQSLLHHLSAIVRNTCRLHDGADSPSFVLETKPNPTQKKALDLLEMIAL